MLRVIILFLIIFSQLSLAQKKKIFFKTQNDSIVSVVDEEGKAIIKPFVIFPKNRNGYKYSF